MLMNLQENTRRWQERSSICGGMELVQVGAVVGVAEAGDHGEGGRGGADGLRQPQRHAAPCPRAPRYALHPLLCSDLLAAER